MIAVYFLSLYNAFLYFWDVFPMKFFAVNSLSHSGSTILSISLASHDKLISLGEIFQILRDPAQQWIGDKDRICSCGKQAADCELWGPALRKISTDIPTSKNRHDNIELKYQIVLKHFQDLYGEDKFAVDTSKGERHLELISKDDVLDPNVFFLIRDVRSYANSQQSNALKQNRKGIKKLKSKAWFQFLKWYFNNKKRLKALRKSNIPYIKVGYEEFCFNTDLVLAKLCKFAKISEDLENSTIQDSTHHILYGNRMRLDKSKQQSIKYDSKWFENNSLNFAAGIFPFIMKFNKKNVYSNIDK